MFAFRLSEPFVLIWSGAGRTMMDLDDESNARLQPAKRRTRVAALAQLKTRPRKDEDGLVLRDRLLSTYDDNASNKNVWALFASLPWEIDLEPLDRALQREGVKRLVPAIVDGDLVFRELLPQQLFSDLPVGAFQVRTPPPQLPAYKLANVDVTIVPGVVFGRDGSRLGYGRGYYDRAIRGARNDNASNQAPHKQTFVGVGFAEQLRASVVSGKDDEVLDAVCTPASLVVVER